jgi:hypothetical protein
VHADEAAAAAAQAAGGIGDSDVFIVARSEEEAYRQVGHCLQQTQDPRPRTLDPRLEIQGP